MRVLITGASGLLGRYLLMTAPEEWSVTPTHYSRDVFNGNSYRMNVNDTIEVDQVFDVVRPDVVVHCAALGSVDYCEKHPAHARLVNLRGTSHILEAAKFWAAKVVFVSTNAVFDGENPPYAESDERMPVNTYGIVKKAAEDLVMDYGYDWMIVRPIMLYGWPYPGGRGNWATRIVEFLSAGMELNIVADTVTQPTYAWDCADAIWKLLRHDDLPEVCHVAGYRRFSLYDYACTVADVWGFDKELIRPVASDHFPLLARRPRNTTYDLARMVGYGISPAELDDGLRRMKQEDHS